jgi:hypothetical protein
MFLYLVCLLLINTTPVVIVRILYERIAALFPGEQSLQEIAQALGVEERSTEITIIRDARQPSTSVVGLEALGVVLSLLFQAALVLWLCRHIPIAFVFRTLYGLILLSFGIGNVITFLGLNSVDSQRIWGVVFFIVYLSCLVGMLRGVIRVKLSAPVGCGTAGSMFLTPLAPFFHSLLGISDLTRIFHLYPLYIGIVLYILISWPVQRVLNRLHALPTG